MRTPKQMRASEEEFAALVHDRLLDTEQVRQLLGLQTTQAVRHRVDHGWYSEPVLVRDKGYSLWDKEKVLREEAARLKAVGA